MQHQIPLGFHFNNEITLDSFVPGPNVQAVEALRQWLREPSETLIYLWGTAGVGKSHLLQATGLGMARQDVPVALLTLREHQQYSPRILEGLEQLALVCIDDIDGIIGAEEQPVWEEALFHLFNRLRENQTPLLVSASSSPAHLALQLADLRSRLGWGLTYQLRPMTDEQKITALQQRANQRGMELNDEVGRYLITRFSREMPNLISLLDTLDRVSLAEQRRLTIPLVKRAITL
ncbi:MAG: DnaA regulatory inactivator Hda [Gammaproteobacteria bacterium]|jgi:DnaA family protein